MDARGVHSSRRLSETPRCSGSDEGGPWGARLYFRKARSTHEGIVDQLLDVLAKRSRSARSGQREPGLGEALWADQRRLLAERAAEQEVLGQRTVVRDERT